MKSKMITIAAALLFSIAALAKKGPEIDPKVTALEGSFQEQRAQIEADLAEGEVYKEIQPEDLAMVRESLDEMTSLLTGVEEVNELPEDQKVALINHQELVNTILTMAELDSRTVCRRTRSTGTHFKATFCETVRERRRRQDRDREQINEWRTKLQMINPDRGGF